MYVIFPAEDLVELTLARPRYVYPLRESLTPSTSSTNPSSPSPNIPQQSQQEVQQVPIPILITPDKSNPTSSNPKHSKTNNSEKTKATISSSNSITNFLSATFGRVASSNSNIAAETSSKVANNSNSNLATASSGGVASDNANSSASAVRAKIKKKLVFLDDMANNPDVSLKDLSHPSLNEHLKNHNAATFKLVRTVSDFTQELSQMYEQHAAELQLLVNNFRKKNAELRKERPACPSSLFHTWENLLQEVEVDSQAHSDVASVFGRQVSRPLLERSFHRKVQARKVFGHRESFELLINKAEEKLSKTRQDYKNAYLSHLSAPNNSAALANYIDAHNTYVTQLHATNAMVDQYCHDVLPALLQELDDVYSDLCSTLSDSVLQGAEVISSRATEQTRRYENLSSQCRSVVPANDLIHFVKSISPLPAHPHPSHRLRMFSAPTAPQIDHLDAATGNTTSVPDPNFQGIEGIQLKNELVIDRLASLDVKSRYESLRHEAGELESQIKQLADTLDTLSRIQQRSLESSLFNKANEIQEDISIKKFDLKNAQLHLASIKAQKDLFSNKLDSAGTEPATSGSRDRKMSSSSQGSMKSKWLKAFKSLKTPAPSNGSSKDQEKKTGKDGIQLSNMETAHQFQEYTYKKITPCDMCSQVLRGHTRQGLKCRLCKTNVHVDCQDKVSARCQPKSRLLRRQKSTSEIETRVTPAPQEEEVLATFGGKKAETPPPEVDTIYQVLKTANEISTSRAGSMAPPLAVRRNQQVGSTGAPKGPSTLCVANPPIATSSGFGHASPLPPNEAVRRRKLFGGVRSFSMFGGRSQGRSISLPEKNPNQYAAMARPFGQPLVLGNPNASNGSVPNRDPHLPSPSTDPRYVSSASIVKRNH